MFNNYK